MKREIIYLFIIILLILFIGWGYNLLRKSRDNERLKESVIAEKNDVIKYHVNQEGKMLGEKHAAELHAKDLERMYPEVYADLEKSFNIKVKDLKAYIKNEFAAHGEGQGTVVHNNYYDSTNGRTIRFLDFSMDDKYLNFNARVFDSLKFSPYKYVYTDTAQNVISAKRKWFLGKEHLYSTTMFSNPNAKITGTTNILVKGYKDKRWAVSLTGGYDPLNNRPAIVIGVGYSIFKF